MTETENLVKQSSLFYIGNIGEDSPDESDTDGMLGETEEFTLIAKAKVTVEEEPVFMNIF